MKFLKVLLVIVILLVVAVGAAYMLISPEVYVERSKVIEAPIEEVYGEVTDLKSWAYWDPWSQIDTNMQTEYAGAKSGVGMIRKWTSEDPNVGNGEMELMEAELNQSAMMELRFPDMGEPGKIGWKFEAVEGGTNVTWTFAATMDGIWKLMTPMMKPQIEKNYEQGLENLNQYITNLPVGSGYEITQVTLDPKWYVTMTDSCASDSIGEKLGELYGAMAGYLAQNGAEMAGMPIAFYHEYEPDGMAHLTAGVQVADSMAVGNGMALKKVEGNAVMTVYFGDYYGADVAYDAIETYLEGQGVEPAGSPWEVYVTDPTEVTDTAQWETHIYFPL